MNEVEKTGYDPEKEQYYMSSNSHDKQGIRFSRILSAEAYECAYRVYEPA